MNMDSIRGKLSKRQWITIGSLILTLALVIVYCQSAKAADAPVPAPAAPAVRALLGGGFLYGEEHKIGYQLFTGVQFPANKYGYNWQLQLGPSWQAHPGFDATYSGGWRTYTTHVEGAGPWGGTISAVIVF